jgi:trigger factor
MTVLNIEEISPIEKKVEVEIPLDLIVREKNRLTSEYSRQAEVPGFRPGKVPHSVIRARFAKELHEELLKVLIHDTFYGIAREHGWQTVGEPRLDYSDPYAEGVPLKYKAHFQIKPTIELGEYRGLEIDDPKIEVSETDVEAMVERLREQASHYRVETERGLDEGDFAVIEIVSSGEGLEPKTDAGHFKMGEETPLPELHDLLRGKKGGESGSFEKAYGEDASQELWRGKTIRHDVLLKEIRVQEKPEVNDEFALSVGGWDTAEQMREAIAADIRRHRESEAERFRRDQIGDQLLAAHPFEVPTALIEEELNKSLNNYVRYLASQGVDLDKQEFDWKKIAKEMRPEAVKRAQRMLILEAIAKKENLTVSDVEVDAEIRVAARAQDREFADVKHHLKEEGDYEALRASMAQDKALDLVLREARVRQTGG